MMPQPKIAKFGNPPLIFEALIVKVGPRGVLSHAPSLNLSTNSDGSLLLNIDESIALPILVHFEESVVPLTVNVAKDASVHLIEHFSAPHGETVFTNVNLSENAQASFYQISEIPESTILHHRRHVKVSKGSNFSNHCINLSLGSFTHDIDVELLGPQASLDFSLLDQLYGQASTTTNLTIFHRSQKTESRQTVRAIYADKAHGTFLGKVIVDKEAAKSAAKQHYKTLLLSAGAKASVMPQLEINNFDISASHGASIGELDANVLFYLQSRGFTLVEAKSLLVSALSSEITETIALPELRQALLQKIDAAVLSSLGACHA